MDAIDALIEEALTFDHLDCGVVDNAGFSCLRCRAEAAQKLRKAEARKTLAIVGPKSTIVDARAQGTRTHNL